MLTAGVFMSCAHLQGDGGEERAARPFTIAAIGDAGEPGGPARLNATLLTNMYTGQHDGGTFDALIFLGNSFYPTGLNVPVDQLEGRIKETLDPYKVPLEGLGRDHVHAIAGNHDYYARNAIEASVLFGLISISELPVGLSDRGNEREAAIDRWTYHHGMPGQAVYPLTEGAADSVQFLFVDSALPLRTDPRTWSPALDSLERLLRSSTGRTGIRWRVLCTHHPFASLGEHGGYSIWNDESGRVEYLTACDKDSNAVGWIKNQFDPEDLCTTKYQSYMLALKDVIRRSGAAIHLALSGHDHSLQLLACPEGDTSCAGCPRIQIISGAGSSPSLVRETRPPYEYTSASDSPSRRGVSAAGFVQLMFSADHIRVVFFDAQSIAPLDMGGGRREFFVGRSGAMEN
jgi:hypothetical protein